VLILFLVFLLVLQLEELVLKKQNGHLLGAQNELGFPPEFFVLSKKKPSG